MSSSEQRRWGRRLVAATLAALPLALGGAHIWVNVVAVVILATAVALDTRARSFAQAPLIFWLVTAAAVATLVQLIPWPMALLRGLSPGAHHLLTDVVDADVTAAAVTLEPAATAGEL